MKNFILLLVLVISAQLHAQQHKERITKSLNFENSSGDNTLIIENINGEILVEGYDGNLIQVEVEKEIMAKSDRLISAGKVDIKLGIIQKEGLILLYMDSPCSAIDPKAVTKEDLLDNRWNNSWRNNCNWNPRYDYRLNFKLRVPRNINLSATTVNHGDITVENINGALKVQNVNGAITLEQVSGKTDVNTINGNVDITYTQNPDGDSYYYTLNGDVNVYFKKGLSAEMYFKSFNGDFFTDIDEISTLENTIEKKIVNGKKGVRYKIGDRSGVKVRQGGYKLEFETFNGDVYVRER